MTKGSKKTPTGLPPADACYEVGYGKPPVGSRFKPGQSGNRAGRPRGSKNRPPPAVLEQRLNSLISEEAYRIISINDASGTTKMPIARAVVRSVAVNAAKGLQRSQRLFTELLSTSEEERRRVHDETLEMAIRYKVDWEIELERRAREGVSGPEPFPHPDQIVIDPRTGVVRITGPVTQEEKAQRDLWRQTKRHHEDDIVFLQNEAKRRRGRGRAAALLDLERSKGLVRIYEKHLKLRYDE